MYLHHILHRPETEMIRKVYEVQKHVQTKNDWFGLVHKDMNNLNINLSDQKIMQLSKDRFKSLVTAAVEEAAIQYLNDKAVSHSKSSYLIKPSLLREKYLEDKRFKRSEVELLFALRTRTVREIKANFPTQYGSNLACELCQVAICCQEHILSCVRLKQHVDIPSDICYSDIF